MPVIQLELDSKNAINGLQCFDSAADSTAKNIDSAFNKVRQSVSNIAAMIIQSTVAIGTAMAAIGGYSLNSAARMQEAQNKYNVVFEGMTETTNKWVANLRNNYGLSEKAAKDYLSSTKAVIDGTKMESAAAAELSNKMVLLAQDLASMHDASPEEAVYAMTAALTGEMEMMKRYGMVITAEEIKQRAMIDNHLKGEKAITAAMKAQAIFNMMVEKSGKAQGDVARSQDSYTFQMKKAKAAVDDISVSIGEQLLPFATQALQLFNDWVREGDKVTKMLYWVVEGIRFVHNGISGIILVGNGLVLAFAKVFEFLLKGFERLFTPIDEIGKALVQLGYLDSNPFEKLQQSLHSFTAEAEEFGKSSKKVFDDHLKTIEKNNKGYDEFQKKVLNASKAEDNLNSSTNPTTGALNNQNTAIEKTNVALSQAVTTMGSFNEGAKGLQNNNGVWEQIAGGVEKTNTAVKKLSTSFKSDFTDETAEEFIKLKDAVEQAAKEVENHAVILEQNATPAEIKYHQALVKLAETAKENLENYDKTEKAIEDTTTARKNSNDYIYQEISYIRNATGEWVEYSDAVANAVSKQKEASARWNSSSGIIDTKSDSPSSARQKFNEKWKDYDPLTEPYGETRDTYDKEAAKISEMERAGSKWNPATGGFDVKGGLSVDQWQSLDKFTQDRLAKNAMNLPSSYDYFSNKSGDRWKTLDHAAILKQQAEAALQFQQMQDNSVSNSASVAGPTVINNFNQQVSRSDVTQIIEETARMEARA